MAVGPGLTLDSGVLSALAEHDADAVALIEAARRLGTPVHVPAVVLAESTTGDPCRDASVNRVVKRLGVLAADEEIGRLAGHLRFRTGLTDATLDALVVATAATSGGLVASRDPDVAALAHEAGIRCSGP